MSYLVLKTWSGFCGRECIITFPCKCYFHQILKFPTSENCLPFPAEKWQIWVKLKSRCPINWGMGISENNPRNWLLFYNCTTHVQKCFKIIRFVWVLNKLCCENYGTQRRKKLGYTFHVVKQYYLKWWAWLKLFSNIVFLINLAGDFCKWQNTKLQNTACVEMKWKR